MRTAEQKAIRLTSAIGSLYFIARLRSVKIGISVDPEARLRSLDRSSDEPLVLLAALPGCTFWDERNVHSSLLGARIRHEWFRRRDERVQTAISVALRSKRTEDFLENLAAEPTFDPNVLMTRLNADASIGTRLRFARCKLGWTLGTAAKVSGINATTIFQSEISGREPAVRTIAALTKAYGISVEELFSAQPAAPGRVKSSPHTEATKVVVLG